MGTGDYARVLGLLIFKQSLLAHIEDKMLANHSTLYCENYRLKRFLTYCSQMDQFSHELEIAVALPRLNIKGVSILLSDFYILQTPDCNVSIARSLQL